MVEIADFGMPYAVILMLQLHHLIVDKVRTLGDMVGMDDEADDDQELSDDDEAQPENGDARTIPGEEATPESHAMPKEISPDTTAEANGVDISTTAEARSGSPETMEEKHDAGEDQEHGITEDLARGGVIIERR